MERKCGHAMAMTLAHVAHIRRPTQHKPHWCGELFLLQEVLSLRLTPLSLQYSIKAPEGAD